MEKYFEMFIVSEEDIKALKNDKDKKEFIKRSKDMLLSRAVEDGYFDSDKDGMCLKTIEFNVALEREDLTNECNKGLILDEYFRDNKFEPKITLSIRNGECVKLG